VRTVPCEIHSVTFVHLESSYFLAGTSSREERELVLLAN